MTTNRTTHVWVLLLVLASSSISGIGGAQAQAPARQRVVTVTAEDGTPIPFAVVTFAGSAVRVADERGTVSIGMPGTAGELKVRRVGYTPVSLTLGASDTGSTMLVRMTSVAVRLAAVEVSGVGGNPKLSGFYDRLMERQKGALSGTFITPEEIEARDPSRITQMLTGVNGVSLVRASDGGYVAMGQNSRCQMTVVIDGQRVRSSNENSNGGTVGNSIQQRGVRTRPGDDPNGPSDANAVFIDKLVTGLNVAAVEVYARGGNIPMSLQQSDQGCGLIAVWTGPRK